MGQIPITIRRNQTADPIQSPKGIAMLATVKKRGNSASIRIPAGIMEADRLCI